tara:strand:- start:36724 stop:36885 length:162 start_codon:yes stop_codon:yes gene_type:complete
MYKTQTSLNGFGNHPVRQRELRRNVGAATLIALYEDRELAEARAKDEKNILRK